MVDDDAERALWAWTLPELAAVGVLLWLVADGLFGGGSFLASASRSLRLALLTFLATELAIPALVYLDIRRLADPPDSVWVHAAAMPLVNVFGVVAYLDCRKRRREG
ncbi:hypothetical protein BRC97_05510 [Halobacteriales archaeon QS_6_71_20]|nr:MAG: hypothetical protein BRC97_05510 [Halobacteriales archaeon QS_6_71_20]